MATTDDYAPIYLDGGGDPNLRQIDAYLRAHFGGRAVQDGGMNHLPLMRHEQAIVSAALLEHRERLFALIGHTNREMNYHPEVAKGVENRLMLEVETTNRLIASIDGMLRKVGDPREGGTDSGE